MPEVAEPEVETVGSTGLPPEMKALPLPMELRLVVAGTNMPETHCTVWQHSPDTLCTEHPLGRLLYSGQLKRWMDGWMDGRMNG